MAIIILVVSVFLDGLLNNTIPFFNLSLFTPLLTLISVISIYPLYKKEIKKYLITIFVTGIIYDLLYTNLLFYNGVLFIIMGLFNIYLNKKIQVNYFTESLILLSNIVVYILLNSNYEEFYNMVFEVDINLTRFNGMVNFQNAAWNGLGLEKYILYI